MKLLNSRLCSFRCRLGLISSEKLTYLGDGMLPSWHGNCMEFLYMSSEQGQQVKRFSCQRWETSDSSSPIKVFQTLDMTSHENTDWFRFRILRMVSFKSLYNWVRFHPLWLTSSFIIIFIIIIIIIIPNESSLKKSPWNLASIRPPSPEPISKPPLFVGCQRKQLGRAGRRANGRARRRAPRSPDVPRCFLWMSTAFRF